MESFSDSRKGESMAADVGTAPLRLLFYTISI